MLLSLPLPIYSHFVQRAHIPRGFLRPTWERRQGGQPRMNTIALSVFPDASRNENRIVCKAVGGGEGQLVCQPVFLAFSLRIHHRK